MPPDSVQAVALLHLSWTQTPNWVAILLLELIVVELLCLATTALSSQARVFA